MPGLRAKRDQHRGETQHLTQELRAKVSELKSWYKRFKGLARVTLADTPQKLEKLGL